MPPTRVVCLQRKFGRIVQDCDIYIGRAVHRGGWDLARSKWANPFTVAAYGTPELAAAAYAQYIQTQPALMAALPELQGKVLGCWCKPGPCHGDILAALADAAAAPLTQPC